MKDGTVKLWIDCAKAAAIYAVIINHTYGVLYSNAGFMVISFYSVSLFILIMGITTYLSEMRYQNEDIWGRVKRRVSKIFWPYAGATFVYSVVTDHMFHLENFIHRLFHFNATPPFYYVFLYIQLIFANVFLYQIVKKCNRSKYSGIWKLAVGILLCMIASLTTLYSNMLDIYGGGGKLLGGTYLILSYIGMIITPVLFREWKKKSLGLLAVGTSILWGGVFYYNITGKDFFLMDARLPFGSGINPPGITLMIYSLIVLLCCFSIISILETGNIFAKKMISLISIIGRNSLYIFLYHMLVLNFILNPYIAIENIWIKRLTYILSMAGLPVLGRKLYIEMKNRWKNDQRT